MSFGKIYLLSLTLSVYGMEAFSIQQEAVTQYDSLEVRNTLDIAGDLLSKAKYSEAINMLDSLRQSTFQSKKWEDHIEAYRGYAICNFNLGNYELALEDRKKLLELALIRLPNDSGTHAVLYNDLGMTHNSLGNYSEAIDNSKAALNIQLNHHGEYHANTTQTLNDLGLIFNKQSEVDSATKYYQWSLNIRRNMVEKNDPSLASSLSNIGTLHARQGNYTKQAEYYEEALAIFLENYGDEHPNVATLYNNLAYAYGKKQDYDKQLLYYEKSLSIRIKIYGENHPSVAESYHNIAGYYILRGNFEKFLTYVEKSQAIYIDFYGNAHVKVASSYHMMGVGYERNGDFEEALKYYKKSVRIYKNKFHDQHLTLAIRYNNMAACYAGLKQWNKQKELLEMALKIRIKALGPNHSRVGSIYNNLGKHYLNVGNFEQAMLQFQSALSATSDIFNDSIQSIADSDLSKVDSKDLLIKILKNKAATSDSLYRLSKDISLLSAALVDLNIAISIADFLRFEISADYSRQKVTQEIMPAYESAISTALRLYKITEKEYYLKQVLSLSEQSKIFQLRLTLQDTKAKEFANIPDSLLEFEVSLKRNIAYLQKALDRAKQKKDASKIAQIKDKLWNQNSDFSKLISFLEGKYPNYYKLKFNQEVATLESIRKDVLDSESMLIEYFFGEHAIYIFQITQSTFKVSEIPNDSTLNSTITNYIKSTSDYDFILSSKVESDLLYTESASKLYDLILKKQLDSQSNDVNSLIIAPDGILNLINFDAILTEKSPALNLDYRTLPYLIRNFPISHTYSATFLLYDYQSQEHVKKGFGGFAPQVKAPNYAVSDSTIIKANANFVRNDISELPASKEEVDQINQLMEGDIWLGSNATEEIFKQRAKDYNVLHLATHGQLDDQNPLNSEILFATGNDSINDGSLSISEIYNLQLNAQLAVLSACNTGQGKILEGEGIKSLSQAFSYAGCPSVIMSLWKVPDAQTRDLMIELYTGLEEELSKDVALRTAKLNYLKNVEDPLYSHPFYWSSFALMGKREALSSDSSFGKWVILSLILLISLGVIPKIRRLIF